MAKLTADKVRKLKIASAAALGLTAAVAANNGAQAATIDSDGVITLGDSDTLTSAAKYLQQEHGVVFKDKNGKTIVDPYKVALKLAKENKIKNPDVVHGGQKLGSQDVRDALAVQAASVKAATVAAQPVEDVQQTEVADHLVVRPVSTFTVQPDGTLKPYEKSQQADLTAKAEAAKAGVQAMDAGREVPIRKVKTVNVSADYTIVTAAVADVKKDDAAAKAETVHVTPVEKADLPPVQIKKDQARLTPEGETVTVEQPVVASADAEGKTVVAMDKIPASVELQQKYGKKNVEVASSDAKPVAATKTETVVAAEAKKIPTSVELQQKYGVKTPDVKVAAAANTQDVKQTPISEDVKAKMAEAKKVDITASTAIPADAKVCTADAVKSSCETQKENGAVVIKALDEQIKITDESIAAFQAQIAELQAKIEKSQKQKADLAAIIAKAKAEQEKPCDCGPVEEAKTVVPPVVEKTPESKKYTVVKNDDVCKIADKFDVSAKALVAQNGIKNPSLIYPGQVLNLDGLAKVKDGTECDIKGEPKKPVIRDHKTPTKAHVTPDREKPRTNDKLPPNSKYKMCKIEEVENQTLLGSLFGIGKGTHYEYKPLSTKFKENCGCDGAAYYENVMINGKRVKIEVQGYGGNQCHTGGGNDRQDPPGESRDNPTGGCPGGCTDTPSDPKGPDSDGRENGGRQGDAGADNANSKAENNSTDNKGTDNNNNNDSKGDPSGPGGGRASLNLRMQQPATQFASNEYNQWTVTVKAPTLTI